MKKPKKDTTVCVRFNPEDVKMISSIATEYGTTVSDVIRSATEGQLSKHLGSVKFVNPEQGNKIQNFSFEILKQISETHDYIRQINVSLNQLLMRIDTKNNPDVIDRLMTTKNGIKEYLQKLDVTNKEAANISF
ncbi:MAG: hypothetical protein K6E91_06925 [Butyrivibrio sp.]|nr:hypothetical protein [Butyrivibrio sp.]